MQQTSEARAADAPEDRVVLHDLEPRLADVRQEVLAGLAATPKVLSPKFFYDERGSQLFDDITRLPEYYPTQAEMAIFRARLDEIAEVLGHDQLLVEYGSGSSEKIRLLLEGLRPRAYMPVEISREHLLAAARRLEADYPWLRVHAVCADYSVELELPWRPADTGVAAFFPGSSIGNFERPEAGAFLRRVHRTLGAGGRLLLGVDRRKPPEVIEPAYDDAQGVTAAFNRNVLVHLQRILGGDVDPERFDHRVRYDTDLGRLEMHLVARQAHDFELGGARFRIEAGESIHTENSYKYAPEEFTVLAADAGFDVLAEWTDPGELFSVFALVAR